MARGCVHFEVMDDGWTQTGEGMAALVDKLEAILRSMLGNPAQLPRVLFSDRGPGFYQSSTGHIVGAYHKALTTTSFRPYAGVDASHQPPDIPDVLPHETVAGWARSYMVKRPLRKGQGVPAMQTGEPSPKWTGRHEQVAVSCTSLRS